VSQSSRPNIAAAGVVMMLSLLLSRVLGVARDATMSGMFGSDAFTDAYRLAFQVPDLLFFMVAGGALSSAFIPVFSEYLHTGRTEEAWHVFSVVTTIMSIVVAALIVLAWVFALPLAHWIAPGKPEAILPLIAEMSRIVLPAQFAFFVGGLMFGTLYARQVFAVPGLGPNVYNLGIIAGAVGISWFCEPRVMGMSWGALIGAVVGSFVIPLYAMRRLGSRFSVRIDLRHPGVRKVFRLMLPVALGLSLPGVYGFMMMWFGSFYDAGVVTWLDYANRLMQAPLGVFGQSLAIAVFPALAQYFAEKNMGAYSASLSSTLRTVVYVTAPIAALMYALAPEIVTVVYEHGRFSRRDTIAVAGLVQYFSLGIAAWCAHPILMRGYFALQHSVTPVVLGTAASALFLGLVVTLRATDLGVAALPLASSVSAWALALFLLTGLRRRIGQLDLARIGLTVAKSAVAASACAFAVHVAATFARSQLGHLTKLEAILFAGGLALCCAWGYTWITRAMGMTESDTVRRVLRRFDRSSNGSKPGDGTAPPTGSQSSSDRP
jgi:putative peptidoglycan lipid II flippase